MTTKRASKKLANVIDFAKARARLNKTEGDVADEYSYVPFSFGIDEETTELQPSGRSEWNVYLLIDQVEKLKLELRPEDAIRVGESLVALGRMAINRRKG